MSMPAQSRPQPLASLIGASAVVLALCAMLAPGGEARAQGARVAENCGALENHYGPYDYTNPADRRERLSIVEGAHLTRDVYELRRGASQARPLGDLDYTLRAFPNHHFALDAMARLHREFNLERFPDGRYSISCWFERARRFQPKDGMVPMIEGVHLFHRGKFEEAEKPLLLAAELMPQSAEVHYNLGLLYVRLKRYSDAYQHADQAYAMGSTLPGLREQLQRAGAWPAGE